MEDAPAEIEVPHNGAVSPIMANFPETEDAPATKPNGDLETEENSSTESDALIIDESAPSKKGPKLALTPNEVTHFNPYFNESLFELSQQAAQPLKRPKKSSPKLREYAQYLGLQPTVQFKCWRCGLAGFESLVTLNEHVGSCTDAAPLQPPALDNTTGFKLTRKVFLCSACGTYYENWNLYVHMLEVHRRYLCLYCLGMFSVLDDLCAHIQSRHNLEPGHKDSLDDFYSAFSEPCYIVCCECNKLFTEQDNFFYHTCTNRAKKIPKTKAQIRPENHVTGDSTKQPIGAHPDEPSHVNSEIVYSSDDELNFKGFTESGDPVYAGDAPKVSESDSHVSENEQAEPEPEMAVETRKVPKLSLKLKVGAFPRIASEEPDHEQIESENENDNENENETPNTSAEPEQEQELEPEPEPEQEPELVPPEMPVAGPEVAIIQLELEQPLDKFDLCLLLQKCLKATAPICIYCNHARKIAVNGKQLGLHAIAEHRFAAVVSSITAEELIPESFVNRIKEGLPQLETTFFSLESNHSDEAITFSHAFECFQCRYSTGVHKELYLHNRKLHAKNLLLCIMCKSNFYSYSELICHLCPGAYMIDYDVEFRCCMCVGDSLPSAFRLMVHLRKRHHVCDVCLEMCHNQYKLSNHVWKHKLHHFCYRCGIAYRNKPDITRHLFWKHGTESVMCKKCLQKKWPHVYHFCVPPLSFACDDCSAPFSRAVALKVHKRIHADEKPHACSIDACAEKFISKKLRDKHEAKHREPPPEAEPEPPEEVVVEAVPEEKVPEEKVKPKVDVYDLPALNLSESDSSDGEEEAAAKPQVDVPKLPEVVEEVVESNEIVLENIWDDFKNYQASKVAIKEKFDHLLPEVENVIEFPVVEEPLTLAQALRDHDYCIDPDNKLDVSFTEVKPDLSQSVDHDYCTAKKDAGEKAPEAAPKKTESSSSDSSSDSDSSCSCGPNCSCSSSSGSSSSSSDSSNSDSSTEEGRKRQQQRRTKRRLKKNAEKQSSGKIVKEPVIPLAPVVISAVNAEAPILESDLETTESETDEEFYDKQPQKMARKLLEEKRNQLLAGMELNGSLNSRSATPNLPEEAAPEQGKPKKSKSKSKKKKKKRNRERGGLNPTNLPAPYFQYYQPPTVAPITLTLRNSPVPSPSVKVPLLYSDMESDSNLRASKRRRVPNKFYGYSSDEEEGGGLKWRKTEGGVVPVAPVLVPPITIKAPPVVPPFLIRTLARVPPIKLKTPKVEVEVDSEAESNDSSSEGRNVLQVNPDALYCYCKCPYDEVSEMIGCDSRDCAIEWFHFECVGIMVPPKGHWYCPECRKKRQQKREMLKVKTKPLG